MEKQIVAFKLDPSEAIALKERAKQQGVNVSQLITSALAGSKRLEGELAAAKATMTEQQARLDRLEDRLEQTTGSRPKYGAKITMQVTETEKRKLRTKAADQGITQSQLLRIIVEQSPIARDMFGVEHHGILTPTRPELTKL